MVNADPNAGFVQPTGTLNQSIQEEFMKNSFDSQSHKTQMRHRDAYQHPGRAGHGMAGP